MAGAFGRPKDDDEIIIEGLGDVDDNPFYVPPGEHPASVSLIGTDPSSAGNPMLTLTFSITAGAAKGKDLKVFLVRTPAAMWRLKKVLKALGCDVSGKVLKIKPKELLGKKAILVVKDEEFNGEMRSNVKEVKPFVAA